MSYVNELGRSLSRPERVGGGNARLAIEYALLFVVLPIAFAVFVPSRWMFPVLICFTVAGLLLLHFTPGFQWRMLRHSPADWRFAALFGALTGLGVAALVLWHRPEAFLALPLENPRLMLMIAVFYPILSALPQELLFRVLYFRRYRPILPRGQRGMVINAGVFALAHLMYWNVMALVLTFAGGLAFAYAYKRRGGFASAFLCHAVAGLVLFAFGLGRYFYSGAVVRPF